MMDARTIRAGDAPVNIRLDVGQVLSVTAPPGSSVLVQDTSDFVPSSVVSGSTGRFGPYDIACNLTLVCSAGAGRFQFLARVDDLTTIDESGDEIILPELASAIVGAAGGLIGPSSTFASLPAAADNAGNTYRVTDIGKPGFGSLWSSDGVQWNPLNGRAQCMRSSIPFILPASGSVGNNGALTLGVALDRIYPRAYMYFPSGALFSGSAAGWYWTVMSSTTVGVVYNNVYTSGYPTIPTTAGFTTTGPGAFTQTAGVDLTCISFTLPGNAVSRFGGMQSRLCMTSGGAGGTKTGKVFFGASPFHVTTIPAANNFANGLGGFAVDGNPTVLKVTHAEQSTGHTNGVTYAQLILTNDITIDKTIGVTIKTAAAATDWVVLQECEIELMGG